MTILTELWLGMPLGSYSATRGWDPPAIAVAVARPQARGLLADQALTESRLQLREAIEERTTGLSRGFHRLVR